MTKLVTNGATLKCNKGTTPARLGASPGQTTKGEGEPAGTVLDVAPTTNVRPFGMCRSPQNPLVQAATSAAGGVLTPQPCVPATSAPWSGGPTTVKIGGHVALTSAHTCSCQWGGSISVEKPGAVHIDVEG